MKYEKAQNILPHGIIQLIQKYTDGGYIYIPRKNENKKSWGENNQETDCDRELPDKTLLLELSGTITRPLSGFISPAITFNKVVFPIPFSPRSPMILPDGNWADRPEKTGVFK